MGGIFKIPLEVSDDLTEVIDRLQEAGIRVCAAALDGQAVPLQQAGLGNGCAVVIGNEGNGLSISFGANLPVAASACSVI